MQCAHVRSLVCRRRTSIAADRWMICTPLSSRVMPLPQSSLQPSLTLLVGEQDLAQLMSPRPHRGQRASRRWRAGRTSARPQPSRTYLRPQPSGSYRVPPGSTSYPTRYGGTRGMWYSGLRRAGAPRRSFAGRRPGTTAAGGAREARGTEAMMDARQGEGCKGVRGNDDVDAAAIRGWSTDSVLQESFGGPQSWNRRP